LRRSINVDQAVETYRRERPNDELLDHLSAMETDYRYTIPAGEFALAHQRCNPNVWVYRFDWPTPILDGRLRACHAVDVPFVFGTLSEAADFVGPMAPRSLSDLIHGAWVSFARRGDPSAPPLDSWPRYEPSRRATQILDVRPGVVDDPRPERRAVWMSSG
jgi:para-nitrobenzyl esterase